MYPFTYVKDSNLLSWEQNDRLLINVALYSKKLYDTGLRKSVMDFNIWLNQVMKYHKHSDLRCSKQIDFTVCSSEIKIPFTLQVEAK